MMYGYDFDAQHWLFMLVMMGVMTVLSVVAVLRSCVRHDGAA